VPYCPAPHPRKPFEVRRPNLPIIRLHDYSSYESIGELRLLEKIHYELEQEQLVPDGEQKRTEFRILVAGDLNVCQFACVRRALSG